MPIPKNWVEELAIEWLTMEGYMAESNVRLKAGERGGVAEADVIGAWVKHEALEIVHIEVGSLPGGFEKNLESIREKFKETKRRAIGEIVSDKIVWDGDMTYEPIFIASYASRAEELKSELERDKIHFLTLEEFIKEKVFKAIERWKENERKAGRRKTKNITLPECYWLLNMLDFLRYKGIIRAEL